MFSLIWFTLHPTKINKTERKSCLSVFLKKYQTLNSLFHFVSSCFFITFAGFSPHYSSYSIRSKQPTSTPSRPFHHITTMSCHYILHLFTSNYYGNDANERNLLLLLLLLFVGLSTWELNRCTFIQNNSASFLLKSNA